MQVSSVINVETNKGLSSNQVNTPVVGQPMQAPPLDDSAVVDIHKLLPSSIIAATYEGDSVGSEVVDFGYARVLETPTRSQRKVRCKWLDYDDEETEEVYKETNTLVSFWEADIICVVTVAKKGDDEKYTIPRDYNPLSM